TIADSAAKDRVGLALGAAMTANQVAIIVVPPALGALYDRSGGSPNLSRITCFPVSTKPCSSAL
ncbi:MAG TPA: hypothetical protein VLL04_06000, partial [Rhizomicrobium sp.]|nr:hypothetical protein [Rhizomicrobium sp.]